MSYIEGFDTAEAIIVLCSYILKNFENMILTGYSGYSLLTLNMDQNLDSHKLRHDDHHRSDQNPQHCILN